MAAAAFAVSLAAVLIALGSFWLARRADKRGDRADRRDAARFAGEQSQVELTALIESAA